MTRGLRITQLMGRSGAHSGRKGWKDLDHMWSVYIFSYCRYKELLAQGRDAANHDFKSEWIPYWTKRVAEIFDNEVLEKTDDLMKKYELSSVVEPRRDQFPRSSSSRRHNDENEESSGARRGEEERGRRHKSPRGGG